MEVSVYQGPLTKAARGLQKLAGDSGASRLSCNPPSPPRLYWVIPPARGTLKGWGLPCPLHMTAGMSAPGPVCPELGLRSRALEPRWSLSRGQPVPWGGGSVACVSRWGPACTEGPPPRSQLHSQAPPFCSHRGTLPGFPFPRSQPPA